MAKEYIHEKFAGGMHYILLDNKSVVRFNKNGNKRVICKLNDELEFHSIYRWLWGFEKRAADGVDYNLY